MMTVMAINERILNSVKYKKITLKSQDYWHYHICKVTYTSIKLYTLRRGIGLTMSSKSSHTAHLVPPNMVTLFGGRPLQANGDQMKT